MNETEKNIRLKLFSMQDSEYKKFQCSLMPTVNPEKVIGVRTPELRKYAKDLCRSIDIGDFLSALPHEYYEENNLHAFLIEKINDYGETIKALDAFLPYVDNWATCDSMSPKIKPSRYKDFYEKIKEWIDSGRTYTVRFGIGMLMSHYLGESFKPEYASLVSSVQSDEYYINMMVAWYFATALAKNYEETVIYLENRSLSVWTHNRTIRKAIESYRISDERKAYLRTLAVK